jgi:hypothetical protein
MKKLALLLPLIFVAAVAFAQGTSKTDAAAKAQKVVAAKTHQVTAEVVSIDAEKHTITLKGETANSTAPVEGKALAALKNVKPGEKVTVTCRDNDMGEHQAVTDIKPAPKTPAPTK